jgi:2-methylcitrate dehydratase PrpD
LATDWEAGKVGFKMYPNVTSIHAALDALRAVLVEERLDHSRIAAIEVGCGQMTFVHTAWEYRPVGITAAQMNMYYGLAVMALRGDVSAADYAEDTISDPVVLALIPRIKIAVDQQIESMGPAFRHAARVVVRTIDGKTFERVVLDRRGSPENAVSLHDIERKFISNVAALLPPDSVDRLQQLAQQLERLPNADELNEIMARPTAAR